MTAKHRSRRYWAGLGHEPEAALNLADISLDHPDWDDAKVIAQHEYEIRALDLLSGSAQVRHRR